MNPRRRLRRAFTLVEILVTIVIIAMLMTLLLPAIQGVRETARRTRCVNNIKQLTAACMTHEQTQGFYPSGGWGWGWVGDADRGFGKTQPGGFIYSCLPYMEQQAIWALPADGDPNMMGAAQLNGAVTLARTVLPLVNCPTRRRPRLFAKPWNGTYIAENAAANSSPNVVARSDYAINGGDQPTSAGNPSYIDWKGPAANLNLADPWANPGAWPYLAYAQTAEANPQNDFVGVASTCSEVKASDITDGTSMTYLLGERYINYGNYFDGNALNDCESWVQGTNNDTVRTGSERPRADGEGTPGVGQTWEHFAFGSAHAATFAMSFADGSVRWMRYDIRADVHKSLCNRKDNGSLVQPEKCIPGNVLR